MMRYSVPALLLVSSFAVTGGCYDRLASSTSAPTDKVGTDEIVRNSNIDLQLLGWEGLQELLAGHRGKVVVLDCWSTSCVPCIEEFPNLVSLQNRHSREDLACVSLSFDYEGIGEPAEQRDRVLDFLQKQGARFDNVLSTLDSDALSMKLEIPSIPAVFVYDRQGRLHRRFDNRNASRTGGPFNYKQVSEVVEQLLAEPAKVAE